MTPRFRYVGPDSGEPELADPTPAVATINAWNRLAMSARTEPGTYRPRGDAAEGQGR